MAINFWNGQGCDSKKGMWITSDGEEILIKNMCPEHLMNCIDYIKTFGGELRDFELDKLDELEDELMSRGKK